MPANFNQEFYLCRPRCCCPFCSKKAVQRERAKNLMRKHHLFPWLARMLDVPHDLQPHLRELFQVCRGTRWSDTILPNHGSGIKLLNIIEANIDRAFANIEHWRWNKCEREPSNPATTAMFDHTHFEVTSTKGTVFNSGKYKKHAVKFFAVCTMQGTFIRFDGPYVGAPHDMILCKLTGHSPLVSHEVNDYFLADLGYFSTHMCQHPHMLLQAKEVGGRLLTRQEAAYNDIHSKTRARIEHSFGCFKTMFAGLCTKQTWHDVKRASLLAKFAALAWSFLNHKANALAGPKYHTCCNDYFKHDIRRPLPIFTHPAGICGCRIYPEPTERDLRRMITPDEAYATFEGRRAEARRNAEARRRQREENIHAY